MQSQHTVLYPILRLVIRGMARLTRMTELSTRREATVARLVDAGIQQFAARGIDATSVEQLCEAAGFSRGAFYSNFSSKDDLCLAILERHRDHIMASLVDTLADVPPASDIVFVADSALTRLFEIIAPSQEIAVTILEIRLRSLRNPELAERVQQFADETRPALVSFVEGLTARLNVTFALSTEQLLDVFEALHFHSTHFNSDERIRGLMAPVAIALSQTRQIADPADAEAL